MCPGWRHVLIPRRHALRAPYGSLLPYDAAGRRVLIAAVPEAGAPYGISETDVARALATGSRTFQLMVAKLLGNWTPFAQLTVASDNNVFDVPVAFDPVLNPLPDLPLGQPFRSLGAIALCVGALAIATAAWEASSSPMCSDWSLNAPVSCYRD